MGPKRQCLFLAAILCLLPGAARADENLLKDGGFEGAPGAWQVPPPAVLRDREARSGAKCLALAGPGRSMAYCAAAGLKPGQFYRVDAWARARGVRASDTGYAAIYMDDVGAFRANLDDHGWECVTAWFQARDDKPVRVYLLRDQIPSGEVLFDDVSLRECTDPNLAPVTFEDGSTLGVLFYGHPGTVARVVKAQTPQGSGYSLLAAPASLTYKMPREITTGLVEFSFSLNLKDRASFSLGAIRLDLLPLILNHEESDRAKTQQSLSASSPGRWYRFRGIVNLDTQRYDLEVTDFEDELGSFSRKNLRFGGKMEKVSNFWLNGPKAGGLFDDLYLGPVRR